MAGPASTLAIKVIPNAPRTEIAGWLDHALKIKVHAPASEGRANEELCTFLAEKLGLPKRAITLLQGEKSRQKVVRIEGLTSFEVSSLLA